MLVGLVILAAALGPIILMFMSSQRTSVSARRLLDATLHGQTVLEGLSLLEPADLPPIPPGGDVMLVKDPGGFLGGGSARFEEVARYFGRSVPFDGLTRKVEAHRAATGELILKMEMRWKSVVTDDRTAQVLTLEAVTAPRNWQ